MIPRHAGVMIAAMAGSTLVGRDADLAADAAASAATAASRAGVNVNELTDPATMREASALLCRIWETMAPATPVAPEFMRALQHAGGYVAGAYADRSLVAASVGFFGAEDPPTLHSHISGVAPSAQGHSIGFALKLHQRAWALARRVQTISWTFDPLVRRNAFFNLAKLATQVVGYLPDFYGHMTDGLNSEEESDRLLVSWTLAADEVVAACRGRPAVVQAPSSNGMALAVGPDGDPVLGDSANDRMVLRVPDDIVALRKVKPDLTRRWRVALRQVMAPALADGFAVRGVDVAGGYLLTRGEWTTLTEV